MIRRRSAGSSSRRPRITTFPQETEPPFIAIPDSSQWFDVIKLAVADNMDETDLLRVARRVRDDLTEMSGISQANVLGANPPEISIEADPMRLRDYGLTFADLSAAIQRSSHDLPAGQIQTDERNLTIRSKGQAYVRGDFENIFIVNCDGAEVSLGKVARVRDGFEENRKILRFAARHRYISLALFLAVGMACTGYFSSGTLGFVNMPSIARNRINAQIRMPLARHQSLNTLDQLRIRTPSGGEAPFHSVATATFSRARSDISRIDGAQVVSISAKPDDENVDVVAISRNFAPRLDAILNQHPELTWRYTGYVAEHEQTKKRSIVGGVALLLVFYALLAIPVRSLYQPFFVMLAIPYGAIGALFGRLILDITPSYLSVFGILFVTVITLYLIPCAYLAAEDFRHHLRRWLDWYFNTLPQAERGSGLRRAPANLSRKVKYFAG